MAVFGRVQKLKSNQNPGHQIKLDHQDLELDLQIILIMLSNSIRSTIFVTSTQKIDYQIYGT